MVNNEENYVKTIHERCNNLIPRFQTLKKLVQTKPKYLNSKFKYNFNRLTKCEEMLKRQIEHLHENHGKLDMLIKQSFENTLREINYQLKELETEIRGKKINKENENKYPWPL